MRIMRKRHILKVIGLIVFLVTPWILITFPQYVDIKDVKQNIKDYTLIKATIKEVAHVSAKEEETYISFEYNGETYIDYVQLDLFDYVRDSTEIAINNKTGAIVRMQISIPLWQWASVLMAIGCMLREQEEYKKQMEKRESRLAGEHKEE